MQGKDIKLGIASVFTALLAGSCCILPFLAAVGATSGAFASRLQFLEPFRPYFTVLTIGLLGLAWWDVLKRKKADQQVECACEEEQTPVQKVTGKFRSIPVLSVITIVALLMIGFPYYSSPLMAGDNNTIAIIDQNKIEKAIFRVEGMTCEGCEVSIRKKLKKLDGIIKVKPDYKAGTVYVEWEKEKISIPTIVESIEELGYKVSGWNELKSEK